MTQDDLAGSDDFIAELAFARRALQRHLAEAPNLPCGRQFNHPHRPTRGDALGYLVIDGCACVLPRGHDDDCVCDHAIQRHVYHIDADGREDYATWPFRGL